MLHKHIDLFYLSKQSETLTSQIKASLYNELNLLL